MSYSQTLFHGIIKLFNYFARTIRNQDLEVGVWAIQMYIKSDLFLTWQLQ